VIVSNDFLKIPVFNGKVDLHFITALSAISDAGDLLPPGRISERETEHSESVQCCYIPNAPIDTTPKAFLTPLFVSDQLWTNVSPDIAKLRELISPNAPALISFDGHKPHLNNQ
jgi:hypothetical protein